MKHCDIAQTEDPHDTIKMYADPDLCSLMYPLECAQTTAIIMQAYVLKGLGQSTTPRVQLYCLGKRQVQKVIGVHSQTSEHRK